MALLNSIFNKYKSIKVYYILKSSETERVQCSDKFTVSTFSFISQFLKLNQKQPLEIIDHDRKKEWTHDRALRDTASHLFALVHHQLLAKF